MNILITGGTGSLGSALSRKWCGDGHAVTVLSRDPYKQVKLAAELPQVRFVLCDVCDRDAVRDACAGQDILIHAAALKIVPLGERHPLEYLRVNVEGTQAVAWAWAETHGSPQPITGLILPHKALFISSDKAVQSLNYYGHSKAIGEATFRHYGFSVIRYGNVVSSRGSFLHVWRGALERGGPLPVRSPEPTRFYLSMAGAVALVENALEMMDAGDGVFVPHSLKAFSVWDVADALGAKKQFGPLLPGEKRHEVLLAEGEQEGTQGRLLSRIAPGFGGDRLAFCSATAPRMTGEEVLEAVKWKSLQKSARPGGDRTQERPGTPPLSPSASPQVAARRRSNSSFSRPTNCIPGSVPLTSGSAS